MSRLQFMSNPYMCHFRPPGGNNWRFYLQHDVSFPTDKKKTRNSWKPVMTWKGKKKKKKRHVWQVKRTISRYIRVCLILCYLLTSMFSHFSARRLSWLTSVPFSVTNNFDGCKTQGTDVISNPISAVQQQQGSWWRFEYQLGSTSSSPSIFFFNNSPDINLPGKKKKRKSKRFSSDFSSPFSPFFFSSYNKVDKN